MGLADWEKKILDAAENGEVADFSSESQPDRVIPAKGLRRLILQQHGSAAHCVRWEIKGATIDETLDLHGGRLAGGGALAPLRFVSGTFKAGFRADGAHLESLRFEGCVFGVRLDEEKEVKATISLRDAHVEGEFRLSEGSALDDNGFFWLDARAIQVGTNFVVRKTSLLAGPLRKKKGVSPGPYGLDLRNATVGGNIFLQPDVTIKGGLRLEAAHVRGNLWAEGLYVTDGEDAASREGLAKSRQRGRRAIHAQSARFDGHLILRRETGDGRAGKPFQAEGDILMYGLQAGGAVDLTGARIKNEGSPEAALELANATVGGSFLSTEDLSMTGSLVTYGCAIHGTFEVHGSLRDVNAALMKVEGDTTIGVKANGPVILSGAHVGGCFELRGSITQLVADLLTVEGNTMLSVAAAQSINLGGANLKGKLDLSEFSFLPSKRAGTMQSATTLGRYLPQIFGESQSDQNAGDTERPLFSLRDADIGHALSLAERGKRADWELFQFARWVSLNCYPGHLLVEVPVTKSRGQAWAAYLCKEGREPMQLDGTSAKFHELNRSGALDLGSEGNVREYLRLFCAYVWGEDGAFAITERKEQLPSGSAREEDLAKMGQLHEIELSNSFEEQDLERVLEAAGLRGVDRPERELIGTHLSNWATRATAFVRYGQTLFGATFVIWKKRAAGDEIEAMTKPLPTEGSVGMLDDRPGPKLMQASLPVYENGLRYPAGPEVAPDFRPALGWSTFRSEAALTAHIPNWRRLLLGETKISFHRAIVDLRDASCSTLEDLDGRAWEADVQLNLENFIYSRIGRPDSGPAKSTAEQVKHRIQWLRQSTDGQSFLPQPYAQLAKVIREQGDDDAARKIEEEKIRLGIRERAKYRFLDKLARPLWACYWLFFRYGLSPLRASLTIAGFLLLGWGAVKWANSAGMLVLGTSPVSTVLVKSNGKKYAVHVPVSKPTAETPDVACGDAINPFLYAVDMFIPLLSLKEESHCDIKSGTPWTVVLQTLKLLYAVAGWIIVSLALLTYSGVTRRWKQE